MKKITMMVLGCCWIVASYAWTNHSILNYYVLQGKAGLNFNPDQTVKVESLASFIRANQKELVTLLNANELWAQQNVPGYHPLPATITFDPARKACQSNLELCFKHALRINPDLALTPIIFDPYNQDSNSTLKTLDFTNYQNLTLAEIRIKAAPNETVQQYKNSAKYQKWYLMYNNVYKQVPLGSNVNWGMVFSAAANVPDFGLDDFLYVNDGKSFDTLYGFGNQPVGIVGVPWSSQILFHMSTYYLNDIFKVLQPGLRPCYPEYRFHQFATLARLAHQSGDDYWAAVFAGYASHYLEDLTQPYHANFIEGYSSGYVLYAYLLGLVDPSAKLSLENRLAAQHEIAEDIPPQLIMQKSTWSMSLEQALADYHYDSALADCNLATPYVKDIVNADSMRVADNFANVIKRNFPSNIVMPDKQINVEDMNELSIYNQLSREQQMNYLGAINERYRAFGGYTRKCLNAMMVAK